MSENLSIDLSESELRALLDTAAARITSPAFLAAAPVQFPRRFTSLPDVEIAALLASTIAWGNRRMICRDCDRMLALLDNQPLAYTLDQGYEDLPDCNIHRTCFSANLRHYLRGLRRIYLHHGTLADFAVAERIHLSPAPAWAHAPAINRQHPAAHQRPPPTPSRPPPPTPPARPPRHLALRWLVRDDGIVDLGLWTNVLKPSQLYIPLDVHVNRTATQLGLLDRRTPDRRAVEQLTDRLRRFRPDDPTIYS